MAEPNIDEAFWEIARGIAKRTVVCHPDAEERLRRTIEARGLRDLITVAVNQYCPPDRAFIFDTDTMEASLNEFLAKPRRWLYPEVPPTQKDNQ